MMMDIDNSNQSNSNMVSTTKSHQQQRRRTNEYKGNANGIVNVEETVDKLFKQHSDKIKNASNNGFWQSCIADYLDEKSVNQISFRSDRSVYHLSGSPESVELTTIPIEARTTQVRANDGSITTIFVRVGVRLKGYPLMLDIGNGVGKFFKDAAVVYDVKAKSLGEQVGMKLGDIICFPPASKELSLMEAGVDPMDLLYSVQPMTPTLVKNTLQNSEAFCYTTIRYPPPLDWSLLSMTDKGPTSDAEKAPPTDNNVSYNTLEKDAVQEQSLEKEHTSTKLLPTDSRKINGCSTLFDDQGVGRKESTSNGEHKKDDGEFPPQKSHIEKIRNSISHREETDNHQDLMTKDKSISDDLVKEKTTEVIHEGQQSIQPKYIMNDSGKDKTHLISGSEKVILKNIRDQIQVPPKSREIAEQNKRISKQDHSRAKLGSINSIGNKLGRNFPSLTSESSSKLIPSSEPLLNEEKAKTSSPVLDHISGNTSPSVENKNITFATDKLEKSSTATIDSQSVGASITKKRQQEMQMSQNNTKARKLENKNIEGTRSLDKKSLSIHHLANRQQEDNDISQNIQVSKPSMIQNKKSLDKSGVEVKAVTARKSTSGSLTHAPNLRNAGELNNPFVVFVSRDDFLKSSGKPFSMIKLTVSHSTTINKILRKLLKAMKKEMISPVEVKSIALVRKNERIVLSGTLSSCHIQNKSELRLILRP